MIPLLRPLVILDVETTGTSLTLDRIVSVAYLKVYPDGVDEIDRYASRVRPGRPIPPEATAIHGITDAMVEGQSSFAALGPHFSKTWRGCDVAGYNLKKFDLPMLTAAFAREQIPVPWTETTAILDAARLWQILEPRTLGDAFKRWVGDDLSETPEGLHTASVDVDLTWAVLQAQLRRPELPQTVAGLHALQWPWPAGALDPDGKIVWKDGAARWTFGKKYAGWTLASTPRTFFEWILTQEFSPEVKHVCRRVLAGETIGPRVTEGI